MEEKKPTDEVIVKALVLASEGFSKLYNGNLYKDALDLIKRLQSENERLAEENKKLVEEIDLEVDLQTKRKQQIITESQEFIDELANKNAELQKQVDELKEELKSKEISIEMSGGHIVKMKVGKWAEMGKVIEEQAVKDTAKDLLIDFNEWINEHYDVKFDAYCVCIPVDKVSEFLTHKAKEYGVEVE